MMEGEEKLARRASFGWQIGPQAPRRLGEASTRQKTNSISRKIG